MLTGAAAEAFLGLQFRRAVGSERYGRGRTGAGAFAAGSALESYALLRGEDRLSDNERFLPLGIDLPQRARRADRGACHAVDRTGSLIEIKARSAETGRS